jgi:ribulose 1,5-bisphosphate synthetase/thiazole synthase
MSQGKRTIQIPAENLPVMDEADVVVVGGGSSGFIAATAAARAGAKTILVERFGYLGGCTTAPYNTSIGVFFDSDGNQIIRGLPWEFLERMERDGHAFLHPNGRNSLWPVWTRKVALDMIREAGVELYFYTWVSDVIQERGMAQGVIVQNKGGRGVILAKAVVDASGDADIAAFCGAPFEMTETENLQQVSCDYIGCGVDAARVLEWARANQDKIVGLRGAEVEHKGAGAEQMLTFVIPSPEMEQGYHVGVMPTVKLCIFREAVRLQGNSDINPLDPKALTYAEINGLKGALQHMAYMQENVPGFENVFLVAQTHLGVRETRRIIGDHMLTLDEVTHQASFDDVVALNCRALDYHLAGTVFKISGIEGHHDVPLGALLPQGVENVAVCGRSVSCDHLSQASLRGAATCMATGHAAGAAAAMAAMHGCGIRELDVRLVQKLLIEQDAILGTGERAKLFA